ncbi:MAG TPA: HAD hydrolase-like protein [Vicinamibacterales bacterium]|nr:HAD hydrolase-like protein [Vicinamibacterales bacterium]
MACLLFDLDGTLTDPERGITACIQHALRALGRDVPPAATLRQYIGPPLRVSFAAMLHSDEAALLDAALAHYRERFAATGLYENEVYPFVPAGLATLRAAGHRLWVATSKPTVYARRIVDHFDLAPFFEGVYGSELTGERTDKRDLVRHIVAMEGLTPGNTWMIGDRVHDIRGGRDNGTHTAGVLWGHGSATELADAGAEVTVPSMAALVAHLAAIGAP